MPREGHDLERTPDPFYAPLCTGHASGPGGGKLLPPCCPKCNIFFSRRVLNESHQDMAMCASRVERRMKRLREEELWVSTSVAFESYVRPLEIVTTFKYLGMALMASDKNWMDVVTNLRKARRQWARISRILGREGTYSRTPVTSIRRWYRQTYCLSRKHGSCPPELGRPFEVSTTGWPSIWRECCQGGT